MYKKFLLYTSSLLFVIFFSCNNEKEEGTDETRYKGKPKIEFLKTTHDFGTLQAGDIVECSFKYKNTGAAPLRIISLDTDCGCTVPKYNKNELLPREEEKIRVVFNSSGFRNNIIKTIDVETNSDTKYVELVITAFIENNQL